MTRWRTWIEDAVLVCAFLGIGVLAVTQFPLKYARAQEGCYALTMVACGPQACNVPNGCANTKNCSSQTCTLGEACPCGLVVRTTANTVSILVNKIDGNIPTLTLLPVACFQHFTCDYPCEVGFCTLDEIQVQTCNNWTLGNKCPVAQCDENRTLRLVDAGTDRAGTRTKRG